MSITVKNVVPISGISMSIEGSEFSNYTRYDADCWYVMMGESDEAVYECKWLEELYQDYIDSL